MQGKLTSWLRCSDDDEGDGFGDSKKRDVDDDEDESGVVLLFDVVS